MEKLKNKVAIVTGGGQGVGLGIASVLASAGASLVITGRTAATLERAAGELRESGAQVLTISSDVRKRADAFATIAQTVERFGRVDILVNNAQSSSPGIPLEDIDENTVTLTIESGLLGTLYHMQAAFPELRRRGGSIINLGSREGVIGGLGMGIYAATKEGIRGLSRTAAREWGTHGIRVNVICPAANTPAAEKFFAEYPEKEAYYLSQIALGRFGNIRDDIGPVALFLASDDSQYVTGQTINVDGGQTML
jgi:NAD(P)-dependent dehydrogenase (short-subunit alcohol dehydrogenase family)